MGKNQNCNACGRSGQGIRRIGMKPGDWLCENCGDLVFSSKMACNLCGTPKPKDAAKKDMRPGDWICPTCGDLVFASKSACKMCGTHKQLDPDDTPLGEHRAVPY